MRLSEYNHRLKEDLARPSLTVSEASARYVLLNCVPKCVLSAF